MPLSDDDVREILRLIDESDTAEVRVETSTFSLHVVRGDFPAASEPGPVPVVRRPAPTPPVMEPRPDLHTIGSPMLGTFYRAPAPGAAPFVEVGARVETDTVVCLIEVMKMMNPVPAGVSGTIVEVCAENAELVEYEAPLFRVDAEA